MSIPLYFHLVWISVWFLNQGESQERKKEVFWQFIPFEEGFLPVWVVSVILLILSGLSIFQLSRHVSLSVNCGQKILGSIAVLCAVLLSLLSIWHMM